VLANLQRGVIIHLMTELMLEPTLALLILELPITSLVKRRITRL
jgi:hypothetical protein